MNSRRPSRVAPTGGVRRGLSLLLGAVVWPGSPQFLAGRRVLGATVMSLVVAVWVTAGVLWFTERPTRVDALGWFTNPEVLGVGRWVVLGAILVWLLLFLDAWRLAMLPGIGWWRAGIISLAGVVVVASITAGSYLGWTTVSASKDVVETVFTAKEEKPPLEGRYNILLIGSDSGKGRTGMRPDSMNVVSIDAQTGAPVIISLPRNLQNVPFVEGSPMQQVYPYGFTCGTECLLNAVHTYTAHRTDLYPDSEDPGLSATIDAIEGATGLSINYHIIVNMKGFAKLVDAIGGVEMDISAPIAMFGSEDAWKNEYIPAGKQRLNGREALWYGRSRVQSDDYNRMGRQKCLLQAIATQTSPQTVLMNASKIAGSSKEMLSTDIPASALAAFADLTLKARNQQISTLSIVPPQYSVMNPNFEQIRADIAEAIAASEKRVKDAERKAKDPNAPTKTPKPDPTATPTGSTNNTDDLASLC